MQGTNTEVDLQALIAELELKQADEALQMKRQFHLTYESLKPVNLIISTLKEAGESKELKNNLVNTSIGLAAGYISKTILERTLHSPGSKLLGTALLFGITNVVAKNPEKVKAISIIAIRFASAFLRPPRKQG